jgi:UDP-glucose 4-epimerase
LHFAALSTVAESVEQPGRYYRDNLCGTLGLLEAMRAAGVKRLVFSSTAAVYGEPEEVPVTEEAPTAPTNPHGGSKPAADHLIGYEAVAHGLAAVSLRCSSRARAAGSATPTPQAPRSSRRPSGSPRGEGMRWRSLGRNTRRRTARPCATLSTSRTSRVHLLALEAAEEGKPKIYNVGNGAGFTVNEVVETARRVTKKSIKAVRSPRRPGGPAVIVSSNGKMQMELGRKPEKLDLETMISDAWNWIQLHSHEYVPRSTRD